MISGCFGHLFKPPVCLCRATLSHTLGLLPWSGLPSFQQVCRNEFILLFLNLSKLILNLSFLLHWKCNSRCAILKGFAIWAKFSFALGFSFGIFTATSCQDAKFFTGMLSLLMIKRIITNFFCVIQIKLGISTYLPVAKSVSFSCSGYLSHTSKHTSHDGRSDQVRIHFPTSYLLSF